MPGWVCLPCMLELSGRDPKKRGGDGKEEIDDEEEGDNDAAGNEDVEMESQNPAEEEQPAAKAEDDDTAKPTVEMEEEMKDPVESSEEPDSILTDSIQSKEQRCSQRLGATGGIREQREINYCLCLGLKQAVSETIYKRRTKGAGGPSNAQASGDGVKSILSRALTRSHHCQQHKIGPCHTSK
ncbi:WD repeat and FYVE domain containing protein 3 [Dissostichus eleginoides]|uniref:WD repeat and FYVE domain containing protein 3 n=1 Tax=Dissostichus eleginoides TaxID=100907 RepID=A0AAD9CPM5_DISEL|nr:WD repeat and FYVE domain containing protein 3 [Dissostichus eleginoides]